MHAVLSMCFTKEKCTSQNCNCFFFFKLGPLHFYLVFSTTFAGRFKKQLGQVAFFMDFWEAKMGPGPFDDQEGSISARWVFSVSVVLSVSVESVK